MLISLDSQVNFSCTLQRVQRNPQTELPNTRKKSLQMKITVHLSSFKESKTKEKNRLRAIVDTNIKKE